MAKITKLTTLARILELPNGEKVLAKYNVPCLFCPMMAVEAKMLTIGQICQTYSIDVKKILKELNGSKENI